MVVKLFVLRQLEKQCPHRPFHRKQNLEKSGGELPVAQQIRPTKLVVEGRAAQRAFDHDLQRTGDVIGLAVAPIWRINWNLTPIDFGHGEAGQAGFGFGAAASGAFVADFAAGAGGCAGEGADGGGVVVGFHLHQHMLQFAMFLIAVYAHLARTLRGFCHKMLALAAFHD